LPIAEKTIRLSDDETVARLLYSKSHFSRPANRPKPAAFDPSPHRELSTLHITGMTDAAVWGYSVVALGDQLGRRTIYARVDVGVIALSAQNLTAVRDDDPFERHTSVHGWPERDDEDEKKAVWKEICLQLSQSHSAQLVVPTEPITRASGTASP
jgi:hypothetical protein